MLEVVAQGFPAEPISISMIWTYMRAEDDNGAARRAAAHFGHARIRHFEDENGLASRSVADSLGAGGQRAWDIYLLYAKDAVWQAVAPAPIQWIHQLDEPWADPAHRAWSEQLPIRLQQMMEELQPRQAGRRRP